MKEIKILTLYLTNFQAHTNVIWHYNFITYSDLYHIESDVIYSTTTFSIATGLGKFLSSKN